MNPLNGLTEYLEHIERRLRMLAVSRGAAFAAGAALAFTIFGVLISNYFAFSPPSVFSARLILFLALAAALAVGLIVPLLRLNRKRAAREAERQCPRFEQRLVTFAERAERPDPFLELLAADTLDATREAEPERIAPRNRILGFASAGALAAAVLLWLAISGVGLSRLWNQAALGRHPARVTAVLRSPSPPREPHHPAESRSAHHRTATRVSNQPRPCVREVSKLFEMGRGANEPASGRQWF